MVTRKQAGRPFPWRVELTKMTGEKFVFIADSQPSALSLAVQTANRICPIAHTRIWKDRG